MELYDGHTTHPDAQWFPKAELGLFLHWGISSVHGNIDLSWGMFRDFKWGPEVIPPEEYFDLAKRFNPKKYDPEKWIKAASDAGFKYAVLTTRHHDSFALWPSDFGDFNTGRYMDGRDLVGEYVKACRRYGMKVGFYYSPPDFRTHRKYMSFGGWYADRKEDLIVPQVYTDYMRAIVRGQLTELLTRYGVVDLLWFDGAGLDYMSRDEIYYYQPSVVIGRGEMTDFLSTECTIPTEEYYHENLEGHWWECCHEWNCGGWGYTRDEVYKSAETIMDFYKTVVVKYHGNLLINMGPNADGELPPVAYERLSDFGEMLKEYKKSGQ